MPPITRSLSKRLYLDQPQTVYKLVYLEKDSQDPRKIVGIAELELPAGVATNEARILPEGSNKDFAMYRCAYADVRSITSLDRKTNYTLGFSVFSPGGYYYTGQRIIADDFDINIDYVCSYGIHYFKTLLATYIYWMNKFCTDNIQVDGQTIPFKKIAEYPSDIVPIYTENGILVRTYHYDNRGLLKLVRTECPGDRQMFIRTQFEPIGNGNKHLMKLISKTKCKKIVLSYNRDSNFYYHILNISIPILGEPNSENTHISNGFPNDITLTYNDMGLLSRATTANDSFRAKFQISKSDILGNGKKETDLVYRIKTRVSRLETIIP